MSKKIKITENQLKRLISKKKIMSEGVHVDIWCTPKIGQVFKNAVWGFVVGDALGVPYEFCSREEMDESPITGMVV